MGFEVKMRLGSIMMRGQHPLHSSRMKHLLWATIYVVSFGELSWANPTDPPQPVKKLFFGRVVLVPQALEARGIKSSAEVLRDQVVLETARGDLLPILPDWRGKAFYQDERLRNRPVALVGYQRPGIPYLQVLQIFTADAQGKWQYTDYWCDVCSIPMYEIKPCDCCQQEIRLRFQLQDPPPGLAVDASSQVQSSAGHTSH